MDAQDVRGLTGVVICRPQPEAPPAKWTLAEDRRDVRRERGDAARELSRALRPRTIVRQDPLVVLGDGDRARGRRDHDSVRRDALERLDRGLRHRDRCRPISAVQLRQPAATAALDDVHLRAH